METLNINTVQMGLLTMLYPLGGLIGIWFSSLLVRQFGSRTLALVIFAVGSASFAVLGFAIDAGNLWLTALLLVTLGLPMAIADFVGNYEGNLVDRASRHSLFPAMHGAFGLGMMAAAAIAGALTGAAIGLDVSYFVIGLVVGILTCGIVLAIPQHATEQHSVEERRRERRQSLAVWREPRSLLIALVGFSFMMAEMTAGTWGPIALTGSGFSGAEAAFAFSVFWVVITVVRLLGGFAVDALGRYRVVLFSAIVNAIGIAIFALNDPPAMAYLGLILWGAGLALGFPMSVSAMGDDPAYSAARINMIITVVYLASFTVGPLLGAVGQVFDLLTAFAIPLLLLVTAAFLAKVTRPAAAEVRH